MRREASRPPSRNNFRRTGVVDNVISDHEILSPAIPRHLARVIHRIAEREGISVATVVKRLLQDALAAEGGTDPAAVVRTSRAREAERGARKKSERPAWANRASIVTTLSGSIRESSMRA